MVETEVAPAPPEAGVGRVLATVAAAIGGILIASLPIWAGKFQPSGDWAAAGLTLLVAAIGWAAAGQLRPGMPLCVKLLLAALIVSGIAMFTSVAAYDSVRMILLLASAIALMVVCVDLPRMAKAVGWAVAAGGVVAGLWGLREYFFTWAVMGASSWRPFAGFLNPNALAGYLLIGIAALVATWASLRREAEGKQPGHPTRILWLVAAILAVLATGTLLLTASKGALLGAFAGAAAVVVVRARRRKLMGGLLLIAVGIILLLPPVRHRVKAAFGSQESTSVGFRARTWAGALAMAEARPLLGWGPGSFKHVYPRFSTVSFTPSAHESWLQWSAECGFPAAALLLFALGMTGAELARRPGPWATAALFALTATVIHNFVDYTWYMPPVLLGVFALMGVGLAQGVAQPAESTHRRPRRVGPLIAALLVLGALTCGWFWSTEADQVVAEQLTRQGFASQGLQLALRSANRAGFSADAWVDVGKIAEGAAAAVRDAVGLAKAARYYERAVAQCPTEPGGYIGAARSLREAGDFDDALEWGARAAQSYPNGPSAQVEYARCLEAKGEESRALGVYRHVLALANSDYGHYAPLQGWADYHLAEAAYAVARASKSPDERLKAWRTAGRVTATWLHWYIAFHASLELGGEADPARLAEMESIGLDAAAALDRTGQAGDASLAAKLRSLAKGELPDDKGHGHPRSQS